MVCPQPKIFPRLYLVFVKRATVENDFPGNFDVLCVQHLEVWDPTTMSYICCMIGIFEQL